MRTAAEVEEYVGELESDYKTSLIASEKVFIAGMLHALEWVIEGDEQK